MCAGRSQFKLSARRPGRTSADRLGADDLLRFFLESSNHLERADRRACDPRTSNPTASPRRPPALGGAGGALRGLPDDHPRPDDRERGTAVDPERPALLTVKPGLGRQRVPDRVRRSAAAGRPPRRPDRPSADLPRRPDPVHDRFVAVRTGRQPGAADRRPLRAGNRRCDDRRGHPRDDRDDVPHAVRAGEGDRRLQLRRGRRRGRRAADGRSPDAGHQLALDLLRQPPDRDRHWRLRDPAAARRCRHRARQGRRRTGRGPARQLADARRVHDRRGRALRLGLGAHARVRRPRGGAAGRLHRPVRPPRPTP